MDEPRKDDSVRAVLPLGESRLALGPQNVPENDFDIPLVVSVTETLLNTTVIGGEQFGWKVAVTVSVKSALPFCTGKSPSAETLCLLAAFG